MMKTVVEVMERGILPDSAIRFGIRRLCNARLKSLSPVQAKPYIQELKRSPLAVNTREANEQHYELPAEFFHLVLGKNLKYSSAYWPKDCNGLDEAEDLALKITMERAELRDGMNILELGCGWGSLTLAMAKQFPSSKIVALSNSSSQREWIEGQAKSRGLTNIRVLTRNIVDVSGLDSEFGRFDRVVSVEMFEHLRNYEMLFERISKWLKPEGKLFVHVFTHKEHAYLFETEGEDNWLGRYFFTGGQMPSHDLFKSFNQHLEVQEQWLWDGTHYGKTSEAWLQRMDGHRDEILKMFEKVYGKANAARWVQRWRVFFMSCAELFHYQKGSEWGVSHYLFSNKAES